MAMVRRHKMRLFIGHRRNWRGDYSAAVVTPAQRAALQEAWPNDFKTPADWRRFAARVVQQAVQRMTGEAGNVLAIRAAAKLQKVTP